MLFLQKTKWYQLCTTSRRFWYEADFDMVDFDFWSFNATFNNISANISWPPVLVVKEAGVLGENHRPWASNW